MKDLSDVIEQARKQENSNSKPSTAKRKDGDIELGLVDKAHEGDSKDKEMQAFFESVEEVKNIIELLKSQRKEIEELSNKAAKAVGKESEKECSEKLEEIIENANAQSKKAKTLLTSMKAQFDGSSSTKKIKNSEIRIRKNLHQTLTQKFVEVLRDHQQTQQAYKAKMKEKVARQLRVVKPDATYDEIDQVLRSGDHGAVYRVAALQPGADPVSEAYLNVRDKYQDVLKLEQSIVELHQMFVDMALLVENQGEVLDKIEFSVNAAEDFVSKGNVELKRALVARKQIRKKYFILLALIIVILVIIIVPLVVRSLPSN